MARLKGLGSFLAVAAGVLLALRALHVGIPLFFPETDPGPFTPGELDEAARLAGFRPLVPSYRPVVLGEDPARLTVSRAPWATVEIAWRGERFLTLTERKGGDVPEHPPTVGSAAGPDTALRWEEGSVLHAIERREDLWILVETDLPSRDFERVVGSLRPW